MDDASVRPTANELRPRQDLAGYGDVVDFLRREISLGRLMPGEKLPAERKLAARLGVARETLRQALRVLEGAGQITIVRGTAGGAIVQDGSVAPHVALHELRQRRESLLTLVEFRGELESVAARMSADRRSEADVRHMRSAQHALRIATTKDESRSADTAFHLAVARSSRNRLLVSAIEDARADMFHPVDLADYDFIKESTYSQHQALLEEIVAGDPAGAAAAMRAHIEASRAEMLSIIDGP